MSSRRTPAVLAPALLALIVLLGAAYRFYGLRWEDELSNYPHPDERHLANTMTRVQIPSPFDWALLNDPDHSPLNPRRLVPGSEDEHYDLAYGTLPVYLYRGTAVLLAGLTGRPDLDTYYAYGIVGRTITILFSLLTIVCVYALGRRVLDGSRALLAAALLAACVLHIQLSHFMTVDLLMSALLTAGVLLAVRFAQRGRTIDALWMGVLLGLTMACKFNGITLGAGFAAAYGVVWFSGRQKLGDLLAYCVPLTLIGWLGSFALFEYYAVRDPYTYARAIGIQAQMVSGETDWPYTRQFVNTAPYLFQLKNLAAWGMGWPLGIAGIIGVVGAAVETACDVIRSLLFRLPGGRGRARSGSQDKGRLTGRSEGLLVLLGWSIPFFVYTARLEVKFLRYMLPLTPILCLLAADVCWRAADAATALWRRLRPRTGIAIPRWIIPAMVTLPTLLWAATYMRVYAQEHPWQAASRWFYENAPRGATYTWEAWGDPLPTDLAQEGLFRSQYRYRDAWMRIYSDMPPRDKLAHIVDSLRQADYVVFSTPRIYLSVSRLPWRYPVEIRYYQLLFTGQLGYELADKFTAYPGLGPWQVDDISADQSFYDYDHPPVLIFSKVRDLSDQEWEALFADQLAAKTTTKRQGDDLPVQLPIP